MSCFSSFWVAPNIRSWLQMWSIKIAKKSLKTCVALTIVLILCVFHLFWCTVLQKRRTNHQSSLDAHDLTYCIYVFMLGCPLICHKKKYQGWRNYLKPCISQPVVFIYPEPCERFTRPILSILKAIFRGVLIGWGGNVYAVSGWVLGGCNTHPVYSWKQ